MYSKSGPNVKIIDPSDVTIKEVDVRDGWNIERHLVTFHKIKVIKKSVLLCSLENGLAV